MLRKELEQESKFIVGVLRFNFEVNIHNLEVKLIWLVAADIAMY